MADDESFLQHVVEQGVSPSDGNEWVAYKLRIMLAFFRIGYSTRAEAESGSTAFDAIYEMMVRSTPDVRPRLANRPHPFCNFRPDDEADDGFDADDDDNDDIPTMASRFFDQ